MIDITLRILGTIFFFIPGFLLAWLIFKENSLSQLIAYTAVFSVSLATIFSFLLFKFGFFSFASLAIIITTASVLLLAVILIKKKKIQISYDKKIFPFITLFALLGTLWRWFFRAQTYLWGDGITSHIHSLVTEKLFFGGAANFSIPNVGFYTGMIADHSSIVAGGLAGQFYSMVAFLGAFETFIAVFILAFFAYKAIYLYRQNHRLALVGSFIVAALGSVEIWQNTFSFFGGTFAYIGLISLIMLYLEKEKSFFCLVLAAIITLALSYYTACLVLILASFGFLISISIRTILENKEQRFREKLKKIVTDQKFRQYLIVLILLLALFFSFSGKSLINHAGDAAISAAQNTYLASLNIFQGLNNLPQITPFPVRPYVQMYKFLRISPLNWQNFFILLMGLTFIISLFRARKYKILDENKNILVAMLPAIIVGAAFALVHYEQRSFSYLLFFAFLIIKMPKKWFYCFAVFSIAFFAITGFFNNTERIIFYANSEGEVNGALWASSNLNGTLLSDEKFISLLIEKGYYKVTGFPDNSPFVEPVFYSSDLNKTKNALYALNINYFITTERMRKKYIIMLNFPQEPMTNAEAYEDNFEEIYSNGDVKIYKISKIK